MPSHTDPHPELPLDPEATVAGGRQPLYLRLDAIAWVGVGGSVGTLARYGLTQLEPPRPGSWPWATFLANIIGAFVLGAALEWLRRSGPDSGWRQRTRLLIGTGFCGGLTTYSTFAVEADLLVRANDDRLAIAYLALSLVGGLLATIAGITAATWNHRSRRRGAAT